MKKILWWIAGAEPHIMKHCPTDSNRQASIGAVILTTAFIAICSGTAAAWFFTQTSSDADHQSRLQIGHVLFGLLWGGLIFMIDHCLVSTMTKNPTIGRLERGLRLIVPVALRLLLATLIAFIISIPVELILFSGLIKQYENVYVDKQTKEFANNTRETIQIAGLAEDYDKEQARYGDLKANYNNLNTQIENNSSQLAVLNRQLNHPEGAEYKKVLADIGRLQSELDAAHTSLDSSRIEERLQEKQARRRTLAEEWNKKKKEEIAALESKIQKQEKNAAEQKAKMERSDSLMTANLAEQATAKNEQGAKEIKYKRSLEQSSQFVRQFEILEAAVNDKEQSVWNRILLWLVRGIFLIIEMLPTVVKVATPIGLYDLRLYDEQRAGAEQIEIAHQMQKDAYRQQMQVQLDAELAMKNDLAIAIAEAEKRVCLAVIDQWEKEQKLRQPPTAPTP